MASSLFGFESPGDTDLQKILGPFYSNLNLSAQIPVIDAPKITETKKPGAGGSGGKGGKAKPGKPNSAATDQAKIDKDFEAPETPLETVADPEPPKKEKVVLSNPQWGAPKPGFNEETPISVDIFLPKENAIKTKVTFELFAKTPKGEERICSGEAHAKDGKATCSMPVYIPTYKDENGKRMQKVEYFFIAKHSEAEPLDGSIAPKVIDEMAERVLETHILQNVTFVTGKSFIRTSETADLKALGQAVKDWKGKHSDGKLAVFGHADAVGAELSNKSLSERRAKSIHAYLSSDPKPWEELYAEEKWGLACVQELLKHLGHDPGTIDGQDGPKTQGAVKEFQGKKGLGTTDSVDAKTREALFLAYFEGAESPSSAAKDFDAIDGKAFTGCSEFNLIENTQGECESNRRVAVLLLKVSKNFPIEYPCKQGAILPCQKQAKGEGSRRTAGFRCKFYDELVVEKKGSAPKPVIDAIEITDAPANFDPGSEQCKIKYKVEAKDVAPQDKGTLVILDVEGKEVFRKTDLPLEKGKESAFHWDGKDSKGATIAIGSAPLKVQLSVTGNPKVAASEKVVKIEIDSIEVKIPSVDGSGRIFMNDPAHAVESIATVKMKKSDGTSAVADIPIEVRFTFSDPVPANTAKASSYQYDPAPKRLGKEVASGTVFWQKHPDCDIKSDDSLEKSCLIKTIATSGSPDLGKAKVNFLPSAVGADSFKIKATILAADKTTVLKEKESDAFTVWRNVEFSRIYEMQGETHVSTNATTAIIGPYFDPAFVKFTAGAANTLAATYSVNYIGLWKNSGTHQESWATVSAKTPAETPTATELTDANYAGADPAAVAKRNTAQAAIKAKAQAWTSRIDTAFNAAMNQWLTDAGIPHNSIVGIRKYHPKYSSSGDSVTAEWNLYGAGTPAWLRVNAFFGNYTNRDPDQIWVPGGQWGGLSVGNGIFSVPNYVPGVIVKVVCHEAGHATKSFFKRDDFGASLDHSVSNAGIMYFDTSGGNNFTEREKKILRGVVP